MTDAPKAHTIGTISIDRDGRYYFHYVGLYPDPRTKAAQFGNWVESSPNLHKLFIMAESRIKQGRSVYLNKIHEAEGAENESNNADSGDVIETSVERVDQP